MKQFSILDALFTVAIVALALGWWFDKRPTPARFQLAVGNGQFGELDTATGQLWLQGMSGFTGPNIEK